MTNDLLETYRLRDLIDSKVEYRLKLENLAQGQAARLGGGGEAKSDRVGSLAAEMADVDAEIESLIHQLADASGKMRKRIGLIENKDLRLILELRYLNQLRWDEVAWKMGYSLRHIYRLHNEAVSEYEKLG